MPYTVQKRGSRYAIVNKGNGHVAGYSDRKGKAQKSAAIRNGSGGKRKK